MNFIFNKIPKVKRRNILLTLIDIMVNNGWRILNDDTTDEYIMYSRGTSDNLDIYLQISPYDSLTKGLIYDVREQTRASIATSFHVRPGLGYDVGTKTFTPLTTTYKIIPLHLYRYSNNVSHETNTGYVRRENGDYEYDLYWYCDKDRLCFVLVPTFQTARLTNLDVSYWSHIGLPEQTYLERREGVPSDFLLLSATGNSNNTHGYGVAAQTPKGTPTHVIYPNVLHVSLSHTRQMSLNNEFQFFEPFGDLVGSGLWYKLGTIYLILTSNVPTSSIKNGDIVTRTVNGRKEEYLFFRIARHSSYTYSGFDYSMEAAIRIK